MNGRENEGEKRWEFMIGMLWLCELRGRGKNIISCEYYDTYLPRQVVNNYCVYRRPFFILQ